MKVKHSFNYIINYKPLLNYKNYLNNNSNIYCKNFFLFFLLLELLKNKSNKDSVKLSIYKKEYYLNSFLRAPNKYKKAQVKLSLVRYKINFTILNDYRINLSSYNTPILPFTYFINYLFYYFLFFESTFFFMEKKKINIKLNNSNSKLLFINI